ncbi:hypothetical protein UB46_31420 [Burkholderiaceae bacterium 16]|nr:hypothetical protein UB46_31420 [Burkholderiaceae bacterium 16]
MLSCIAPTARPGSQIPNHCPRYAVRLLAWPSDFSKFEQFRAMPARTSKILRNRAASPIM